MASTLTSAAVRTEAKSLRGEVTNLNDLRAGDGNLRMDAKSTAIPASYGPYRGVIREAMRRADLSQKAFAIDAKQPISVISEALGGTRNLAGEWVWMQTSEAFHLHRQAVEREARGMDQAAIEATEDRDLADLFTRLLRRTRRTA